MRGDSEPGPSQEQEEAAEAEIITHSLSLRELQDVRKNSAPTQATTLSPAALVLG